MDSNTCPQILFNVLNSASAIANASKARPMFEIQPDINVSDGLNGTCFKTIVSKQCSPERFSCFLTLFAEIRTPVLSYCALLSK